MFLNNWWSAQSSLEQIFWSVALVFSLLLIMQTLTVIAFDQEEDSLSTAPDRRWGWLSVRMVLFFFAFGGWVGLILAQFITPLYTILLSAIGLSLVLAISLELLLAEHAAQRTIVNSTGQVFESVPPHKIGMGKVRIRGHKAEWRAITSGEELLPGAPIRIVEQVDEEVVVVEALPQKKNNPHSRG